MVYPWNVYKQYVSSDLIPDLCKNYTLGMKMVSLQYEYEYDYLSVISELLNMSTNDRSKVSLLYDFACVFAGFPSG